MYPTLRWNQYNNRKETVMPRFIIERNFAEQVELNRDAVKGITSIWTLAYSGCFRFSAPNAEAIREAARRLNIPADVIIEVDSELRPDVLMRQ
jgi:hypothetical protein